MTKTKIEKVNLEDLIISEYKSYEIYTLMDRAIPYVIDGLKPSQRRILYTLWKNKNKGLIKVSSATGLVLTLHPHGPASIENSIVNLAKDFAFTNNYPLLDKKGYFGERMETAAAAARYIECKLSKIADLILFDDMNQIEFIPNYDEKTEEPPFLLPKLPIMLLNGAEGIGAGYSSMIPSFHHEDIINSMISVIKNNAPSKLFPFVNKYKYKIDYDKEKNRYLFYIRLEQKKTKEGTKYIITDLPRGYNADKIRLFLNELIDEDFIKEYIDNSKKDNIEIELIFKNGQKPNYTKLKEKIEKYTSITPNYTLIQDNGVIVFKSPEEIITEFTKKRIDVVKKRYELLLKDEELKLCVNNELIRFIKDKHYTIAEKKKNKEDYIDYLKKNKFTNYEYLSELPIYRMTKEEVEKRKILVEENKKNISEYKKIYKSEKLIKDKLIEELLFIKKELDSFLKKM